MLDVTFICSKCPIPGFSVHVTGHVKGKIGLNGNKAWLSYMNECFGQIIYLMLFKVFANKIADGDVKTTDLHLLANNNSIPKYAF